MEDDALCGQLREAAISISGNIAEGFGHGHKKDKINFYFYSRGSAFKVRSHLYSGKEATYFTDNEIDPISINVKVVEDLNKVIKGLNSQP
ncbi:MAG: four helix bundle protein [Bacteroidota bacterium]